MRINQEAQDMNTIQQLKKINPINFLIIAAAGMINAFGITIFLAPVKLYDSGISGTSMLLSQITPLSLSWLLLLLNIPLFLYGYQKQGKRFTVYSVFAVAMYSISAWLITDVLPVDVDFASPLAGEDLLLCAIFGGIISGVGSGLTIRYGGAMDGIEVLAVIFAKRLGLTVGTFVMAYNVLLYSLCGIAMGSWILPLYSIITYMAGLKTIDFIVEGLSRSKSAMIVTTKPDQITAALSEEFGTGITIIDVKGGYSGDAKYMIYFVVNRFQIANMKSIVHSIDHSAYISVMEVAEVYGAEKRCVS